MMIRPACRPLFALAALMLWTGVAVADPPGLTTLPIGAEAPDFRLPGVDGKTYSLKDFADAKVLVVVFTCNHCPTAQAYEERIARLHADYKDKGVAVVAISPNDPAARPARRAGLHRPRRLVRGHEDPRQGPQVRLSRTSTTATPRRRRRPTASWPRRTSTSSTPTASSATSAGSTTRR